jgi:hypothetical protein
VFLALHQIQIDFDDIDSQLSILPEQVHQYFVTRLGNEVLEIYSYPFFYPWYNLPMLAYPRELFHSDEVIIMPRDLSKCKSGSNS